MAKNPNSKEESKPLAECLCIYNKANTTCLLQINLKTTPFYV